MTYRDDLRRKFPGLAARAAANSRQAAIRLHCLECLGTSASVDACDVSDCFLWPFRLGRPARAPGDAIISPERDSMNKGARPVPPKSEAVTGRK